MAKVCNKMDMPIAVIKGASLGAPRNGLYAIFSMAKFKLAATTQAHTS